MQDFFAAEFDDGAARAAPTDAIDVTRTSGRSLRVSRLPLAAVQADLAQRRRLADCLEGIQLLVPQATAAKRAVAAARRAKSPGGGGGAKSSKRKGKRKGKKGGAVGFKVGANVEFDTDGTSTTFVPAEVLKVHPGGRLYDLDPKEAWVGRQTRVPAMFLRSPKTKKELNSFNKNQQVPVFEGLSDSEDEEWKEEAEEALDREKAAAANKAK